MRKKNARIQQNNSNGTHLTNAETLVALLEQRAEKTPHHLSYRFLKASQGIETIELSYSVLREKVCAVAAMLQTQQCRGERALILIPQSLDYIVAYFACLYAGVVAVPVYPPRNNRHLERLSKIVTDCKAKFILTLRSVDKRIAFSKQENFNDKTCLCVDEIDISLAKNWVMPDINQETLAFLQYTSGSTGSPKGVMVTHANLLANLHMMVSHLGIAHLGKMVSWLPLYHDMGLIGGMLLPMYTCSPCVLMSPTTFTQRPIFWLQTITDEKATISPAPNFAYELCLEMVHEDDLSQFDLSSWKIAINGAEPIRTATIKRFSEKFSRCGFKAITFTPSYGLAEATLAVSFEQTQETPTICAFDQSALEQDRIIQGDEDQKNITFLVSSGKVVAGLTVKIVNPNTLTRCQANEVGEIWLSGPSVAQGYYGKSDQTNQVFKAKLSNDDHTYLRTGDLGFLDENNYLFITGRLKDLIILNGRNLYPQDIEIIVAQAYPSFKDHSCAAFSVEQQGQERLIVVQEVHRHEKEFHHIFSAIRLNIVKAFDAIVHEIILIKERSLLKTTSGKIQRHACRLAYLNGQLKIVRHSKLGLNTYAIDKKQIPQPINTDAIQQWLAYAIAQLQGIGADEVALNRSFSDYGVDSLAVTQLAIALSTILEREINPAIFWEATTIQALADVLVNPHYEENKQSSQDSKSNEPIALIGVACRFPGDVNDLESFWQLLKNEVDPISNIPDERDWQILNVDFSSISFPQSMICQGGFIKDIDQFDAEFFAIAPRETEMMDPQQRLLLEVSWEALEKAKINPETLKHSYTGVFIGLSSHDYGDLLSQNLSVSAISPYFATGNSASVAAGRIAYFLGLRGPCMAIDTACSSSLVALHNACLSLQAGECNMALCGGVNLILNPTLSINFAKAEMLSETGRCRTFDESADGYVRSEGCAVVVLKRLKDAIADGDTILSVIRGSAVNQDGDSNGLTAPNMQAQVEVMKHALSKANLSAVDISYVEAHGTGTPLGDPIEVQAISQVYKRTNENNEPLYIGSVKSNIGHLEAAAGMAGLIKVILALQHRAIPGHLHLNSTNPLINLDSIPATIPQHMTIWPSQDKVAAAGVSSFGFSGTNAHVILSEYTDYREKKEEFQESDIRIPTIFSLSAKNKYALTALTEKYKVYIENNPQLNLSALCFTIGHHRCHFNHRLAWPVKNLADLKNHIDHYLKNPLQPSIDFKQNPKLAFLYTGQGSQIVNMGKTLYQREPIFRRTIEQCISLLDDSLAETFIEILYPENNDSNLLNQTRYTQPILFSFEYALTSLWRSWGIEPQLVLGHSVGEYVAACVAGVFSLADALTLISARGRLMEDLCQPGSMLAVRGQQKELEPYLTHYKQQLSIAAFNGPQQIVISGESKALTQLASQLKENRFKVRPLVVSHGFHSPLMQPMLSAFQNVANQIQYHSPEIDIISNVTGKHIDQEIASPKYWVNHVIEPVRFAQSIQTAVELGCDTFLEIGPQPILTAMAQTVVKSNELLWLSSLRKGKDNHEVLAASLADLYTRGMRINWQQYDAYCSQQAVNKELDLPTYPFRRKSYWMKLSHSLQQSKQIDISTFCYHQHIEKIETINTLTHKKITGQWLILHDDIDVSTLKSHFTRVNCLNFYTMTFNQSLIADDVIGVILVLTDPVTPDNLLEKVQLLYQRLLHLFHAFLQVEHHLKLLLVTNGIYHQSAELVPLYAPLIGFTKVLRLEASRHRVQLLDIGNSATLADPVLSCLQLDANETDCVCQDNTLYGVELHRIDKATNDDHPFKPEGLFLITGGLGQLGLLTAKWLINQGVKQLALVSRSKPDPSAQAQLKSFRQAGITITHYAVDISDNKAVYQLLSNLSHQLKGIIHTAGVLADTRLIELKWEDIAYVFSAKVTGSWWLHQHSQALSIKLNYFICYSSISASFGNYGQANYAAANSFLDGLMRYRQGQGLPGMSIAWSAWSQGMATKSSEMQAQWDQYGIRPLTVNSGFKALDHALSLHHPTIMIADINWQRFLKHYSVIPRYFQKLVPDKKEHTENESTWLSHWRQLPEDQQRTQIYQLVEQTIAQVSGIVHQLDPDQGFFEMGMDSLMAVQAYRHIQNVLGNEIILSETLLFDQPNLTAVSEFIYQKLSDTQPVTQVLPFTKYETESIAIVGMGCRFPAGIEDPEIFWQQLVNGVDTIAEVPEERWPLDKYYSKERGTAGKMYCRYGSFIQDLESFDAAFFNISPREAELLDPQQRLVLEVAWHALEDAHIPAMNLRDSLTGVFIGVSNSDYSVRLAQMGLSADRYSGTGGALSAISGRLSYFLGLQGPSLSIDTACSSSLVSIHEACQSLRQGECELAIAGGVNVTLLPEINVGLCQAQMLSEKGHCSTFSEDADGYVRGEGCGIFILKRYRDALKDRDQIHGIIRSSVVSQDGASSGLTVPRKPAQVALMKRTQAIAGIDANAVDYVEAHGTGTPLGDPIEMSAITEVYGQGHDRNQPLVVGAVKSQIGHLEAAAGIAGMMKAVLALKHQQIPPNLHCNKINSKIDIDVVPIHLPTQAVAWEASKGHKRFAGVSSFGFTGTIAHAILEEAPCPEISTEALKNPPYYLFCFSAKTDVALKAYIEKFHTFLTTTEEKISDISYSLNIGRSHFLERAAFIAKDRQMLITALEQHQWVHQTNQTIDTPSLYYPTIHDSTLTWKNAITTIAHAYIQGRIIDFSRLEAPFIAQRRWVSLPGYAFQKQSFWLGEGDIQHFTLKKFTHYLDVNHMIEDVKLQHNQFTKDEMTVLQKFINLANQKHGDNDVNQDKAQKQKLIDKQDIYALDKQQRLHYLQQYLEIHIRKLLKLNNNNNIITQNLFALGIDSLMVMDLSNQLHRDFKDNISFGPTVIFEHPTIQKLSHVLCDQLNDGDTRIHKIHHSAQALDNQLPSIEKVNRNRSIPASYSQCGLWFIDQLENGSSTYNIPVVLSLTGKLDESAFLKSISDITHRHEILRTAFVEKNGEIYQVIKEIKQLPIQQYDLTQLSKQHQQQEIDRHITETIDEAFDLEQAPLFRMKLLHLAEESYLLYFAIHHIIFDGWSFGLLMEELRRLYKAYANNENFDLPPLNLQYADYAVWQRKWMKEDVSQYQEQISYWKQQLSNAPRLQLPRYKSRPKIISHQGSTFEFLLDQATTKRLHEIAQNNNTSMYVVLVSIFNILLSHYSQQRDICLGSVIANRHNEAIDQLLGYFVNTVVLRNHIDTNITFHQLLGKVSKTVIDMYAHQDIPFDKLIEALKVERGTDFSPLFQVMFVFQNFAYEKALNFLEGMHVDLLDIQSKTSKFEQSWIVQEKSTGLVINIEYATDLFDKQTIARMAQHFCTLTGNILNEPDQLIGQVSLLSAAEYKQVLTQWNQTQVDFPNNQTIPQLFQEQVKKHPDHIAVVYEDEQFTYLELDERSNQLAHYLQGMGVGPEVLVGLALERSLEMMITLLGILKAGGAYIPLDPDYPASRIAYMLTDSQAQVLVTQEHIIQRLSLQTSVKLVCIDQDQIAISQCSLKTLKNQLTPSHLAYVIYTSGTTGRPKGVAIEHKHVVHLACAQSRILGINEKSRVLQFSSINFDASVWEIFVTLFHGGALYIPSAQQKLDKNRLVNYLRDNHISIATIPPAMIEMIEPDNFDGLQTLITAGEQLSITAAKRWIDNTRLINAYGPTEVTVCASTNTIERAQEITQIGRPIANVKIYILDPNLNPVPVGIPGEIYVAGMGVARGYLNQTELTSERFIKNPFITATQKTAEEDIRLYKTGDMARFLANGSIEFLGRIDEQVKLRGFRIELGEIETNLLEHQSVQAAAVIVTEQADHGKQLIAFWVPANNTKVTIAELRSHLSKRIPDHMLPAAYVELEVLPITPSGKIDRNALRTIDIPSGRQVYIPPSNEIEAILSEIWSVVLKVERVGIEDNFFHLGGHSLLATQVISRIRNRFKSELPIRALFENPTIHLLAQLIQDQSLPESYSAIIPIDRSGLLPLSFAQERLWFIDRYEGGQSAFYNIPLSIRLHGQLHIDALESALNHLIERHEILRTHFIEHSEVTYQKIVSNLKVCLQPESCKATQVKRLLNMEAQKPFNLATGPLIRVRLFRIAADNHVLSICQHHIISDGWSVGILWQELTSIYRSLVTNEPIDLVPLTIQYADFSYWQRQQLSDEFYHKQLDYWQQQLSGVKPLQLPTDKPRPKTISHQGAAISLKLDRHLSTGLHQVARDHNTSIYTVLLAVLNVLLSRYSRQNDICIGTPIANRHIEAVEPLIGFFVNTLVMRNRLTATMTFSQLLEQVIQTSLEAYSHQDIPFGHLVKMLDVERDTSQSPLFQVMLAMQDIDLGNDLKLIGGLEVEVLPITRRTAKFDLTWTFHETNTGFVGEIEYASDIFEKQTVKRMAMHFTTFVANIIQHPNKLLKDISIISQKERQQIQIEWNQTQKDIPYDKTIIQLFVEQASKNPDGIALVFEDQHLTYRQLNERSNQIAHYLQKLDVGPGILVALAIERSLEMIICLLGILKAGGAYVPLDPQYPTARLSYMLRDSGAKILLTQEKLLDRLSSISYQVVCIDKDWEVVKQSSKKNIKVKFTPENLAYVIYTSGSTGEPKGVMIEHHSIVNIVLHQGALYQLSDESRSLQFASINFDASVEQIFTSLLYGGTLYIANSEQRLSLELLGDFIQQNHITTVNLPPSALEIMPKTALSGIKTLIVGGDVLTSSDILDWIEHLQFINAYGPTEACITASVCAFQKGTKLTQVGRPISNVTFYILDAHLQIVPIGVPGELHIGGICLARGYLNRPHLTKERFIENPFVSEYEKAAAKNLRLYKTGDLARYLPDGNIEFIGRIDNQVKVRGYRIELEEIQNQLQNHDNVKSATVIVHENQSGDKNLIAYWVGDQKENINHAELRSYLSSKLPDYMIPAQFIQMDVLPLMPNGKIDQKSLPRPDLSMHNAVYVPPNNEIEAILVEIWASILDAQQRIGITDNFFHLGGHSLLATQVISRIRSRFHCELPVRSLFEHPTICQLAELIQTQSFAQIYSPIEPISRNKLLPLSFAQQRLWFIDQYESGRSTYFNIPVYIRLCGRLNISALESAFNYLFARHEILRTHFIEKSEVVYQKIIPSVKINLIVEQCNKTKLEHLLNEEAQKPFDLSGGPLIRIRLFQITPDEHVLSICQHHIISDGWSIGILWKELKTCYRALLAKKDIILTPFHIQYADFAYWQRQQYKNCFYKKQLNYWKKQLEGVEPLQLLTDKPRPKTMSHSGAVVNFIFDEGLTEGLHHLARTHNTSLYAVLLTALNILLSRYCRQDDICVGTPIANRHIEATEPLIGFFVNTLVMRNFISEDKSFSHLLEQVSQTALDAYSHQDIPFEQLVESLVVERDTSHSPLFQVMLVLQNFSVIQDLQLSCELEGELLTINQQTAKYDLTYVFYEANSQLSGSIEYCTDLFQKHSIERMLEHFKFLLHSVIHNCEQPLNVCSLSTEQEQHQILYQWNRTDIHSPIERTLPQLFNEQVEKTPDHIAVIFENESLSYRELNDRSNQFAHYLQGLEVQVNDLVAIAVERSLEMIIAVLGVMKAGAAYVPLDPDYPEARLQWMLDDSDVKLLASQSHLLNKLPETKAKVICLDRDWDRITQSKRNPDNEPIDTNNPAYVIYTSGSTGRPKGVVVPHKGIVNYLLWRQSQHKLDYQDKVLQKTPTSFDVSVWEIFWPLITGAQLILAKPGGHRDSLYLKQLIEQHHITTIHFVPSMLSAFLEEQKVHHLKSLRQCFCSGEALSMQLQKKFFSKLPHVALYNLYGPTEASIDVTAWQCQQDLYGQIVPIGRPIDNIIIYILDQWNRILPIGIPGELHIGGIGLADGYLNRPDLSQDKFIDHSFASNTERAHHQNCRLYKSGDLARYMPNGNIEYLGRIDDQVKLRGFRIELGEIETHLKQYPGIAAAAVLLHKDLPNNDQLVAYWSASEGQSVDTQRLRQHVQHRLPEYMMPSVFIKIDNLPLTPSGKIDRKVLLKKPLEHTELTGGYIAPSTEIEIQIAALWSQALSIEKIGVEDNFFVLGGHSLLALNVIQKMNRHFQMALSVKQLFDHPTIAKLAQFMSHTDKHTQQWPQVKADLKNRFQPFPLSGVQYSYWIGRSSHFELGGVATHGYIEYDFKSIDVDRLQLALNRMIQRHEMLRIIVQEDGQQCILQSVPSYKICQQTIDVPIETNPEPLLVWRNELSHQVFDPKVWPLFEFRISHCPNASRLHLSLDALIFDGLSQLIFIHELVQLYQNLEIELSPLMLSFRDYIIASQQLKTTMHYEQDKAYWMQRLEQLPFGPQLPLQVSPRTIINPKFARYSQHIPSEKWKIIKEQAIKLNLSPTSVVLAVYALILAQWSKNSHFLINLTLFNRFPLHDQVNDIIGDFTSLELLEVKVASTSNFYEFVRTIHEQLWRDLDHRLFDGVEVQRELVKMHGQNMSQTIAPVVLTAVLNQVNDASIEDINKLLPNLIGEAYSITQTSQVWLDNKAYEVDGSLVAEWDFVQDLFPDGMIESMHQTYCDVISGLATLDWQGSIPNIVPNHERQIIQQVNKTDQHYQLTCIHQPFINYAKNHPNTPAIFWSDKSMTYGELARRANQITHMLLSLSVKPNQLVAIVMEKGWQQIIAALGILQSGAAYLPIQASWPIKRIEKILEISEARVIFSQKEVLTAIKDSAALNQYQIFAIDNDEFWTNYQDTPVKCQQTLDDIAYVIFTSGSTGQPKGVVMSHRGVMNTLIAVNQKFDVKSSDRILALSELTFDLSVYDIFGILSVGGAIVIPNAYHAREPQHWVHMMKQYHVTLWNTVPMYMQMLIEYLQGIAVDNDNKICSELRAVLLSGDWLPVQLPKQIWQIFTDTRIMSLGGATEGSIWSIWYEIQKTDADRKRIPYGKPMPNQNMYVYDEVLQDRPVHTIGDIYIGGTGVALGYWRDDEKTKASFMEHPRHQQRIYKTGDLGRWLPSGNIEIIGRDDYQVKVGGHRIELGEIETILIQLPEIKEAVVVVQGEVSSERRLIAYVVAKIDKKIESSQLQNNLRQYLPEYMIPALFIWLANLPLSANGKVDRKALPTPQDELIHVQYVAPRNQIESAFVELWSEVLGIKQSELGVNDNFFELGGDSLLATQVITRIRTRFSCELPIRALFEHATIASLTNYCVEHELLSEERMSSAKHLVTEDI